MLARKNELNNAHSWSDLVSRTAPHVSAIWLVMLSLHVLMAVT